MRLYGRRVVLQFASSTGAGKSFDGIHVDFRVEMTMDPTPNKAKITAFNLSADTIALCQAPGAIVRLLVGYEDDALGVPMLIFQGNPTPGGCKSIREGETRKLEIEASDGGTAYRESTISVGFAGPTQLRVILDAALAQMGLPAGYLAAIPDRELPRGFSATGPARDVLSRLAAMVGAQWTIRDGAVQLIGRGQTSGETAQVFSAAAGNLIGSPSAKDDGIEVKALIAPTLRPGKLFRLIAEQHSGDYRAEKVVFEGSNYGQSFYVTATGSRL